MERLGAQALHFLGVNTCCEHKIKRMDEVELSPTLPNLGLA